MTGRCRDFRGPAEPVIATSHGWGPLDEPHAAHLAASGMLLTCSPEHVAQLQRERMRPLPPERVAAGQLHSDRTPDSSDWQIPLAAVLAFEERSRRGGEMADGFSRSLDAQGTPLE